MEWDCLFCGLGGLDCCLITSAEWWIVMYYVGSILNEN